MRKLVLSGGGRVVGRVGETVTRHRRRQRGLHRVFKVVDAIGGNGDLTMQGLMLARVVVAAAGAGPLLGTVEAERTCLLTTARQGVILDALAGK